MKHFKSLLSIVVFALALTFTSCMSNDPTQSGVFLGRAEYGTGLGLQFDVNGLKVIPTSQALFTAEKVTSGDIVLFSYSYNSDEQPLTSETKSLTVEVTGVVNCGNERTMTGMGDGSKENGGTFENATIVNMTERNGYYSTAFGQYGKNTLVLPIYFLAKADLSLHSFALYYDESTVKDSDTEMKLYLRHKSEEKDPTLLVPALLKAFDIRDAVNDFAAKTGENPKKITILTNETKVSGSDKLEDANEELGTYTIDYVTK